MVVARYDPRAVVDYKEFPQAEQNTPIYAFPAWQLNQPEENSPEYLPNALGIMSTPPEEGCTVFETKVGKAVEVTQPDRNSKHGSRQPSRPLSRAEPSTSSAQPGTAPARHLEWTTPLRAKLRLLENKLTKVEDEGSDKTRNGSSIRNNNPKRRF